METFYRTLAQVSFTLLGLWLVVVQLRREEWQRSARRRLGARAVTMHFTLPGIMSLLVLANPDSALLWRVSFAVFAVLGGLGLWLLGGPRDERAAEEGEADPNPPVGGGRWPAIALYVAIAAVAVLAVPVSAVLAVEPLQVTAVLLSLLLLASLNVVYSLLFRAPAEAEEKR